jgi:hypothetical protein
VWGVSFAGSFVANNTIVAKTTINPGQSVSTKTDVTQLDRPITLTVGIDRSGGGGGQQQQMPLSSDVMLKETVSDPGGQVVSSNEFGDSFVTSIKPQVAGAYTVTITNLGEKPVSIGGTFGYMPFIDSNGKPDINALMDGGQGLGMIIAGGLMAVAGVVTLIVGGIITVADSRGGHGTTTTSTSERGVTYRKD